MMAPGTKLAGRPAKCALRHRDATQSKQFQWAEALSAVNDSQSEPPGGMLGDGERNER